VGSSYAHGFQIPELIIVSVAKAGSLHMGVASRGRARELQPTTQLKSESPAQIFI
jgi:hypothetical protein